MAMLQNRQLLPQGQILNYQRSMGAQRGPYGLNNDSQPVEHISKATPTGQKKATKTIRTNI
jgi:hypothetical protein